MNLSTINEDGMINYLDLLQINFKSLRENLIQKRNRRITKEITQNINYIFPYCLKQVQKDEYILLNCNYLPVSCFLPKINSDPKSINLDTDELKTIRLTITDEILFMLEKKEDFYFFSSDKAFTRYIPNLVEYIKCVEDFINKLKYLENLKKTFNSRFKKMWDYHRKMDEKCLLDNTKEKSSEIKLIEKDFFNACDILKLDISKFYNASVNCDVKIANELNMLFPDSDKLDLS